MTETRLKRDEKRHDRRLTDIDLFSKEGIPHASEINGEDRE